MATATYGGWTGKTLRVNLSTRKIATEDTIARYKDYLGGTGIGYKVLWDEVPAKTKAFDEANKIVIATGPLTGTSAPTAGGRRSRASFRRRTPKKRWPPGTWAGTGARS